MKTKLKFIGLLIILSIGYFSLAPTPRHCPSELQKIKFYGNAGCLIVNKKNEVLVVEQTKTKQLTVPAGGFEFNETASCTAFRETFEESGQHVSVKDLVLYDEKNNFYLFNCEITKNSNLRVAKGFENEISNVMWVNIENIPLSKWRFPNEITQIKKEIKRRKKK